MNVTQSFYLGIASGIAVVVLLYVFRRLLGQLASLITGIFSRDIRGTWATQFWKIDGPHDESADVYQWFHWIWGEINYPRKGRKYSFRGTLRSDVLVATYEVKKAPSTVDRGAFTLHLNRVGDVSSMTGKYSWTDDETQKPASDRYEWTRPQ